MNKVPNFQNWAEVYDKYKTLEVFYLEDILNSKMGLICAWTTINDNQLQYRICVTMAGE